MIKQLASVIGLCGALLLTSEANAQTLPPPWQWTDVGAVGTPGEVHVGANTDWFVSGAGSNVWGTADSFLFAYQPIRDGRIFATIDSETNTNSFAKAGIMIRQTLAPGGTSTALLGSGATDGVNRYQIIVGAGDSAAGGARMAVFDIAMVSKPNGASSCLYQLQSQSFTN